MPGPKRGAGAAAPARYTTPGIVEVLDDAAEPAELPDPRPYQTVSYFETTGPGGQTVRHEQWNWNRRSLAKWLAACPKATVFIPLDPNNDGEDPAKARPYTVRIDGIPIDVPKGRPVQVARPIAEIIEQAQQKYRTAQSQGLDTYAIKADDELGRFIPDMSDVADVPASAWRE